jgi:hypothetical protein
MAPNLQSAKQAIEAELTHARQGIDYYTTRVKALESALQQLEIVEGEGSVPAKGAKRRASAKNMKANESRRGRKARGAPGAGQGPSANGSSMQKNGKAKRDVRQRTANASNMAGNLPSTGSDFWLKLVGNQPQSAVDIANAAIATLGIKPDQKQQIKKLKQRVSPALVGLVSAQRIKDSGAGRARRFFKNDNQAA